MSWHIARTDDLERCLAIRHKVFVEEQNVPIEDERDAHDAGAIHLLARDGDTELGTARILLSGDTGKIGRVCVLPPARGTGLGAGLIRAAMEELRAVPGISRVRLAAQISAIGFYEKLGFVAEGPEFDDAGIPHRMMSRDL